MISALYSKEKMECAGWGTVCFSKGAQSALRSSHWSVRIVRHQLVLLQNALSDNSWTYASKSAASMESIVLLSRLSTLLLFFLSGKWHLSLAHVYSTFRLHSTTSNVFLHRPCFHLQLVIDYFYSLVLPVSRGQRMTSMTSFDENIQIPELDSPDQKQPSVT